MKNFLLLICFLSFSTTAFAVLQDDVIEYENKNSQKINVTHDKHEYFKKGRYTYRINKNGDLVGYYKTTSSGKKITAYDMSGNIIKSYRMSPSGKMIIYNSKGARIN